MENFLKILKPRDFSRGRFRNHNLSDAQAKELKEVWNVDEIITLSDKGIKSFEQVTAKNYNNVIDNINREIAEINPDIMLIQGQAGDDELGKNAKEYD